MDAIIFLLLGAFAETIHPEEPQPLSTPEPVVQAVENPTAVKPALLRKTLSFEPNEGQWDSSISFLSRAPGFTLALQQNAATLSLRADNCDAKSADRSDVPCSPTNIHMSFPESNPAPTIHGRDQLTGTINYFLGSTARTRIPTFAEVRYENVYPGIDTVFYGNDGHLEYDFVVSPGADPSQIRVRIEGSEQLTVQSDGSLRISANGQDLIQHSPIVYQIDNGKRVPVDGRLIATGNQVFAFLIGDYDTRSPLVIDPVLDYSTFIGGSFNESASAVATDSVGNTYVTGRVHHDSRGFPITPSSYDSVLDGEFDAFVSKFDPSGTTLMYSTYLGGEGFDEAFDIAVDANGNAYIAGRAGSNFPVTEGAYFAGSAFVSKLNASGTSLVYSARIDGNVAHGLALGANGSVYVTGETREGDYTDAFVARLTANGSALHYLKTFGGSSFDVGEAIAVDSTGNAYVVGRTYKGEREFPTTSNAYDRNNTGSPDGNNRSDAFVLKLSAPDGELVYSTLLGGSDFDTASSVAVDASGYAYVGGQTGNSDGAGDFPTTPGALSRTWGGFLSGFVSKLNPSGTDLVYSTYIGGSTASSSSYDVQGIALDSSGYLYVTGAVGYAPDFPISRGALDESHNGGVDVFVMLLDPLGSRSVYSTYIGGSSYDYAYGIALDPAGSVYVTGVTSYGTDIDGSDSIPFPTTLGAYDRSHNGQVNGGGSDAFDIFSLKLRPIVDSSAQFATDVTSIAADTVTAYVDVVREGNLAGIFQVAYQALDSKDPTFSVTGNLEWGNFNGDAQKIEIPLDPVIGKSRGRTIEIALSQPNGRLGERDKTTIIVAASSRDEGQGNGGGSIDPRLLFALTCCLAIRLRRAPHTVSD